MILECVITGLVSVCMRRLTGWPELVLQNQSVWALIPALQHAACVVLSVFLISLCVMADGIWCKGDAICFVGLLQSVN